MGEYEFKQDTLEKEREILKENVRELQEQLQNSYRRNGELINQVDSVSRERDTLVHHHLAEEGTLREEITNKKSLTTYVENAMTCNIKTFQTILGKLKGV